MADMASSMNGRGGPSQDAAVMASGMSFVGTGIGLAVMMALRHRRGFLTWAIPGILIAFGLALLGTAVAGRYGAHVDETEQAVRDQLSHLDPFARVKVLKDLAEEQVPSWARRGKQESMS